MPSTVKIQKLRKKLSIKQDNLCYYCGVEMKNYPGNDKGRGDQCTLDHILPKSKGGDNNFLNVVASCANCNRKKGDKDDYEQQTKIALNW